MNPIKSITCFIFILLSACAPAPELIRDVQILPQSNVHYLAPLGSERRAVSEAYQKRANQRFDSLFFLPWHASHDSLLRNVLLQTFDYFRKRPGWGENRRRHPAAWISQLEREVEPERFPNTGWPGITVGNVDLKSLPTRKPVFEDFNLAGEGYPFDYNQKSAVAVNTPVRVLHVTKDKSWLYVDNPVAPGWLPAEDVASVDSAFIRQWESGRYAAVVKDETPAVSPTGSYLFHAPLGAVFPMIGEDSLHIRLRAALADAARKAVSCEAVVQRAHAVPKPLPLTLAAVAGLADELLHEPYGWGGLLMNRDCSALIRDLFVPFGIALPRYSADQILSGFGHVDLEALSSSEKEQAILRKGIPFLTMIGPPGHIMLYIGQENGRALVFHNFWGVRTRTFFGKEGRHVVGETVITTLFPGRELRHFDSKGGILNRVSQMSFVVPPDSIQQ